MTHQTAIVLKITASEWESFIVIERHGWLTKNLTKNLTNWLDFWFWLIYGSTFDWLRTSYDYLIILKQ